MSTDNFQSIEKAISKLEKNDNTACRRSNHSEVEIFFPTANLNLKPIVHMVNLGVEFLSVFVILYCFRFRFQ